MMRAAVAGAVALSLARMAGNGLRPDQEPFQMDRPPDMLNNPPPVGLLDAPEAVRMAATLEAALSQPAQAFDSSAPEPESSQVPAVKAPLRAYAVMDLMENPLPGVVIDVYHRGAWGPG